MQAISGALSRMLVYLDNGDRLRKQMRELAKQHYNMGITPEMFDCFGRALVQTLKVWDGYCLITTV
jgi:hemoglobin-like flavoprotein